MDERDYQHLGAWRVEPVEMTLERAMEDHVSRADPVPPSVAGFVISARENDRGERLAMTMPRQDGGRVVPHPARSRAPEPPIGPSM